MLQNIIGFINKIPSLILYGLYIIWCICSVMKLSSDMSKAAKIGKWTERNHARQVAYNIFRLNLILIMITLCVCLYVR